ncbi:MAG: sensor diguanylate cyclase [Arthrobacter sp.]|nr:sensor diguanylate cyclase [Arthrobacter sp.]
MKTVERWQLLAAPVGTAILSALDNPSVNNWSGGPYFLRSMSVMIALAAWELGGVEKRLPPGGGSHGHHLRAGCGLLPVPVRGGALL